MPLHLLDDLPKPLSLIGVCGPLGQDHRLKRVYISWQGVGQSRHDLDYSISRAS